MSSWVYWPEVNFKGIRTGKRIWEGSSGSGKLKRQYWQEWVGECLVTSTLESELSI